MKIARLDAQGVRGLRFQHEFSAPVVCFVGPNGSGKTARLAAIKWALTGEMPGVGKRIAPLLEQTGMDVQVRLGCVDWGLRLVQRRAYESKGKAVQELDLEPCDVDGLTVREGFLSAALGRGTLALNALDWFATASDSALRDFLQVFIAEIPDIILEDLRAQGIDVETINRPEDLMEFEKTLRAKLNEERRALREAKAAKQSLKQHTTNTERHRPQAVIREEIEKVRQELTTLEAQVAAFERDKRNITNLRQQAEDLANEYRRVEQRLRDNEAERNRLLKEKKRLEETLAALPQLGYESIDALWARVREVEREVATATEGARILQEIIESMPKPPRRKTCEPCKLRKWAEDLKKRVTTDPRDLQRQSEELRALLEDAQTRQRRLQQIEDRLRLLEDETERYTNLLETLRKRIEETDKALRGMQAPSEPVTVQNLISAKRAQLQELEKELTAAIAVDSVTRQVAETDKRIHTIEARVKSLKQQIEAITQATVRLTEFMRDEINKTLAVAAPLLPGLAGFHLEASGRAPFRFGIERDEVIVPPSSLSSSEVAAFALTLCAAHLTRLNAPVKVFLIDNLERFDEERLPKFLEVCKELTRSGLAHQIFLASARPVPKIEGIEICDIAS